MTARECAALQGAPNFRFTSVSENKALFGFGDAVCVPVIAWLAQNYVAPLLRADQLVGV
jgi:DNA (cytosine-5)-methyltransferase 1